MDGQLLKKKGMPCIFRGLPTRECAPIACDDEQDNLLREPPLATPYAMKKWRGGREDWGREEEEMDIFKKCRIQIFVLCAVCAFISALFLR